MKRRRLLQASGAGLGVIAIGGVGWLAAAPAPVALLAGPDQARDWIGQVADARYARTVAGWPIAQLFEHAAQSVEFSLDGYPQPEPAWFQASAGRVAYRLFARRGRMSHDLDAPIPGAPALSMASTTAAAERLIAALDRFERHDGPLAAHFAFGALDKAGYRRAHLMHLADHASRVDLAPA